MSQSIAKINYSEVNAGEEQEEINLKKNLKKHQLDRQSCWSTTFSKNKIKIISTVLVLVFIMVGSMAFFISSHTSWTKKTSVKTDLNDTMIFDDLKKEEIPELNSLDDDDNNNIDQRLPQLRSYKGHERRRPPYTLGRMNVYVNDDDESSYRRFRIPVARYARHHNPFRGPFLNFLPSTPIFVDRLTKQTMIYSQKHVYIVPALINKHGRIFSLGQLISSGYASLVSSGVLINGNIDMHRFYQSRPLFGDGIPGINPRTGGFNDRIRSNFGSFSNAKEYDERSDNEYSRKSEKNIYYERRERKPNYYLPQNRPNNNNGQPNNGQTTTTALPPDVTTTKIDEPIPDPDPVKCESDAKARTPFTLRPFRNLFKNPTIINPLSKECRSDGHCIVSHIIDVIDVRLSVFEQLIPECALKPQTAFKTYNGLVPGPTFHVATGVENIVRFNNKLGNIFKGDFKPCTGSRQGTPFSVHHHGSASAPPWDGWAEDETCFGETKEYIYPDNRPATEWYHDHAVHITAFNAYHGLAGLYIVSSKKKDGGCGEPWNLDDIKELHLILQDKVLDLNCQLVLDINGTDEKSFYGDINLVSGIPFPVMRIEPIWYRLRFLDASVSRPYLIKIKNALFQDIAHLICKVFASDAGYLRKPVTFPLHGLLIGVAERYEIVCDFRNYANQTLYLWNDQDEDFMKDVDYFCYSHYLAKIEVSSTIPNSSPVFDENIGSPISEKPIERALTDENIADATKLIEKDEPHRVMKFERRGDQWVINGETWDSVRIAAGDIGQNTWELWKFETGGGWFHPIHVHLVDFYILVRDRDGGLHTYEVLAPKDILYLGPSQNLWVIIRFGPHKGDYMFHCHNLIHEDDDMMRAFRVINVQNGLTAETAEPFIQNDVNSIVYSNWKYTDPMLTELLAKPTAQMPPLNAAYMQNILLLNPYQIFYPKNTDDPRLLGPLNPWRTAPCSV